MQSESIMPRNISAASLEKLAMTTGLEPINVVTIQWIAGGTVYNYADKKVNLIAEGRILELTDIEAVLDLSKSATSTTIRMKLDDSDGVIKQIFDNNDIHARPVKVYQWFTQLSINEKFLVFEGAIASPIEWTEADRTLSFDILTKLDDVEVGFSVEAGDFTNVPVELLGKSWPMIFGTVVNVPTLQMDSLPTGTIRIPIGIPDHTLDHQINYVTSKMQESLLRAYCLSSAGADLQFEGEFNHGGQDMFEQGQALERQAADLRRQVGIEYLQNQDRLKAINTDQTKYDVKVIPIINGHKFIQRTQIELLINSAHYVGSFDGDNFAVTSRRGPDEPVHKIPKGAVQKSATYDLIIQNTQEQDDKVYSNLIFNSGNIVNLPTGTNIKETRGDPCQPPNFYIFTNQNLVAPEANVKGKFFFANAGTAVKVGGNYPVRYILSIIPGTTCIGLAARCTTKGTGTTADNLKMVNPIPPELYTVSEVDYGGIRALIATFHQPLSTIIGTDWEDEVFATLTSPIGPNVVDILIYLIERYTTFFYDTVSFTAVHAKLANYPANFALLQQKNVVELLKEIAWQSRCAIWVADNVFYIKYLPEDATPVETITESDVDATGGSSSLVVSTTTTEELVTKFIAKWKPDYTNQKDQLIILRYNVNKYGLIQREFDFYIYNDPNLVIKSATFWLIRMANVWKTIKCKTYISKLKLETLDTVNVDFAGHYVANVPVNGIVQRATFNSSDMTIDLDVWLPVRLGEMYPYIFAYPADIDPQIVFPTDDDVAGKFAEGPSADAAGDLGAQYNVTTFSVPSPTRRVAPSDRADAAVLTTVVSQFGPGTGATPPLAQQPTYEYRYRHFNRNENNVITDPQSKVLVGQIVDGSGDTYRVDIFPTGRGNNSIRIEDVKQLQIDSAETIPPATWVMVTRTVYYVDKKMKTEYTIQVPVFLEDAPE